MTPLTAQLVRQVVWEPLAPGARVEAGRAGADRVRPEAGGVDELFGRLVRFGGSVRALATSPDPFPWGTLDRLIGEVTATLAKSDHLFWIAHRPGSPAGLEHLALHHARVAVLALRLGTTLGYEGRRLAELGMAASLFDVGLWQLPETAARQADPLSPREQDLYRSHPRLGAALVRRWSPPSDVIMEAILQHHEREQGQGYPQGLRGPAIHPDAKIIGLADAYAALTSPTGPRPGRPPHDAIRDLMRVRQRAYDPVLIRALVSETSLFPPGTLVRLSNGEIGRVIALNRTHPLRPRVELLAKANGVPRTVDLVETPFLYITGAIGQ